MYLSHTLPGDPLINNLSEDQVTWYLMAYQEMQLEESQALENSQDSLEDSNDNSSGNSKRKIYGYDNKGSRVLKGEQNSFRDDDTSWKDKDGDFELIPEGMSKSKIEAQLEELSRKEQKDFMEKAGGDFERNFTKYNQKQILDSKNIEAKQKLKEMQEKSKYLESIGKSRANTITKKVE
jgi:hypothetical protein